MRMILMAAMLAVALAGKADAEDVLLDLSTAELVAAAVQDAGYKAELKKAEDGSLYILSAANGESFTIEMTDCKMLVCNGLSFQSYYKPEPIFTTALVNEWNQNNRFLKASINKQGELCEWFEVTTRGKLTKANFADVIDWYVSTDASLAKFLQEKRNAAKPKK